MVGREIEDRTTETRRSGTTAEESRKLFQPWAAMLEENSRKTRELLQGTPDPEKYREFYDTALQ